MNVHYPYDQITSFWCRSEIRLLENLADMKSHEKSKWGCFNEQVLTFSCGQESSISVINNYGQCPSKANFFGPWFMHLKWRKVYLLCNFAMEMAQKQSAISKETPNRLQLVQMWQKPKATPYLVHILHNADRICSSHIAQLYSSNRELPVHNAIKQKIINIHLFSNVLPQKTNMSVYPIRNILQFENNNINK